MLAAGSPGRSLGDRIVDKLKGWMRLTIYLELVAR
jgi:hypothetical protein